MRRSRVSACALAIAASLGLAACGSAAPGRVTAASAAKLARFRAYVPLKRPLDLAGPRGDGTVVVAAAGRLELLLARAGSPP